RHRLPGLVVDGGAVRLLVAQRDDLTLMAGGGARRSVAFRVAGLDNLQGVLLGGLRRRPALLVDLGARRQERFLAIGARRILPHGDLALQGVPLGGERSLDLSLPIVDRRGERLGFRLRQAQDSLRALLYLGEQVKAARHRRLSQAGLLRVGCLLNLSRGLGDERRPGEHRRPGRGRTGRGGRWSRRWPGTGGRDGGQLPIWRARGWRDADRFARHAGAASNRRLPLRVGGRRGRRWWRRQPVARSARERGVFGGVLLGAVVLVDGRSIGGALIRRRSARTGWRARSASRSR